MGDAGCLLFQDLPRDRTMRWLDDAGVSVYRAPSGYANGQTRDRQGRLIACSHRERCLLRIELDGSVTRLVDRHDGRRLNSPNDVTVKSDGSIWFTDPLYGIQSDYEGGRQPSEQPPAVYRFEPDSGRIEVVAGDFDGPNGLAFSPDERRLYVAQSDQTAAIWRVFDVKADGTIENGRVLFDATSMTKGQKGLPDGLKIDTAGNLFATGPGGVLVLTPEGRHLGTIRTGQATSNCAFGDDGRTLYMTADMYLMRVRLKTRGAGF
jgi:gluconolactonase